MQFSASFEVHLVFQSNFAWRCQSTGIDAKLQSICQWLALRAGVLRRAASLLAQPMTLLWRSVFVPGCSSLLTRQPLVPAFIVERH